VTLAPPPPSVYRICMVQVVSGSGYERPGAGLSAAPLLAGIASMVVGVAAVLFSQSARLDATKLLVGGAYLREDYRVGLLLGGIAVAVVGLVVTVVVIVTRSVPGALMAVGVIATTMLALVGGVLYASYRHPRAATPSSQFADPLPASDPGAGSAQGPGAAGAPGVCQVG